MKIFIKYIQAFVCVYIYIYKIISLHGAPTYVMQTQTFILNVINRD